MTKDEGDLGLQILLAARAEVAATLSLDLVRQCYAIQKKYQFAEDRTLSMSAMERLIDSLVAKSSANG